MLVNNEIGVIQPIEALAGQAHAAGALFLCDAVQGFGRAPIPGNVDLVALSAHKIHGPKGIGALWIRNGVTLTPLLHGGDQEGGRSGTLSPALCAGFGVAAMLMAERAGEDAAHVERLWDMAADRLDLSPADPSPLPGVRRGSGWTLNGDETHRYLGNLNVRRDGLDVARLMSDCRDLAFSGGIGLRQRLGPAQPRPPRDRPHGRTGALVDPAGLGPLYDGCRAGAGAGRDRRRGRRAADRGMTRVTFVGRDGTRTVDGEAGVRLLDIARADGQPLEGTCDGDMACATCHVVVDPADFARLPRASAEEEEICSILRLTPRAPAGSPARSC